MRRQRSIAAPPVIWATGRRRGFLRSTGSQQHGFERLISYLHYFADADADPRTLIEAVPEGWRYAAGLPGGDSVVAFQTDADLGRRLDLAQRDRWLEQLSQTALIGCRAAAPGELEIRAAVRP